MRRAQLVNVTPSQLSLGISFRPGRRFSNFIPGRNHEARLALKSFAALGAGELDRRPICLWGAPGTGKSHLLEASCAAAAAHGASVGYLPLREHEKLEVGVLEGLEALDLLCLDDLDAVVGNEAWEERVFHLFNRAEAALVPQVMTMGAPPPTLPFLLPDLASRVSAALGFRLQPLRDEDRRLALQAHAKGRGLELPDEVANFVIARLRRDMGNLVSFLERLDHSSLAAQRRLTIPFVREHLEKLAAPLRDS